MALRNVDGSLEELHVPCKAWLAEDLQVADSASILILDDVVQIELNANLGSIGPIRASIPRTAIRRVANRLAVVGDE